MLPELNEKEARERIAGRIAADLEDGALVNLGIGIPQLIPNFMPEGVNIFLDRKRDDLRWTCQRPERPQDNRCRRGTHLGTARRLVRIV